MVYNTPMNSETPLEQWTRELSGPDPELRCLAAAHLRELGDWRALPALVAALKAPISESLRAWVEPAIATLVQRAAQRSAEAPDPAASARVQARVDALTPRGLGDWPTRASKDVGGLPAFYLPPYLYAVRPDGVVLEIDDDRVFARGEEVTAPLARFALVLHGAVDFPELIELLPPPAPGTRLCTACMGQAWTLHSLRSGHTYPMRCAGCHPSYGWGGFGWVCP